MPNPKDQRPPGNPRYRAGFYGMAALYLLYLFYQIAKPYLTGDPYGPTRNQFLLGLPVLGGGAAVLAVLAWRMYKVPPPEDSGDEDEPDGD